jgi:hypothetical protein
MEGEALMSTQQATKLKEMVSEINDIVEQTYYLEQKIYEWSQTVKANKEKISKSMGRNTRLNVRVDKQTEFSVSKKVDTELEFFSDSLSQKLDKKVFNRVTNKTMTIENINGLVKFLKSYGVDPKEFKNFIKTSREVDVAEVERLIDLGEIQIEDLQGCFKAEFSEEIKVRKSK